MKKIIFTAGKVQRTLRMAFMVLAAVVLAGCTLMIDEPENGDDPSEENGDGFTSPKTVTTDGSIVTYQFTEGTMLLDESYRKYISDVTATDTIGGVEIIFSKDIPAKMMPQRGNGLATELFDLFENGLNHRVDYVENTDRGYRVAAHVVHTKEIYKTLKITAEGYVVDENPESRTGRGGFVGTLGRSRAGNEENKISLVDISVNLLGGMSFSNVNLKDKQWDLKKFLKGAELPADTKGPVSINGDINAGIGLSIEMGTLVHFEYDSESEFIESWIADYKDVVVGAYAQEIKGTISVALVGNEKREIYHSAKGVPKFASTINDWLLRFSPKGSVIVAGPVVLRIYPSLSLVADVFASLKTATPLSFGYRSSTVSKPYGFRYEDGELTEIPGPRDKGKEDSFTETNVDKSLSFILGSQLHANVGMHFEVYGLLDFSINADATATLTYDKTIYSNKYKIDPPEFNKEDKPSPIQDAKVSFDVGASLSLEGKVDLRFTTINLFSIKAIPPFTIFSWSMPMRDDYELVSEFRPYTSTFDEYHYLVRVKSRRDGLFITEDKPKYIAFYTNDGEYITYMPLKAEVATGGYDDALIEGLEIVLPAEFSKKYGKTITAVLFTEDNQYATPQKFALANESITISNVRQVVVLSGEKALKMTTGQQALGLAFNIKGDGKLFGEDPVYVAVTLKDTAGNEVGYNFTSLYIDPNGMVEKDFLMFIKTPAGKEYTADVEVYYIDRNDKKYVLDDVKGVELSPYTYPEENYDFNNPGKWSGYELIY